MHVLHELQIPIVTYNDYVFGLTIYVSVDFFFFVNDRVDFNAGDEHDLIHGQLVTLICYIAKCGVR